MIMYCDLMNFEDLCDVRDRGVGHEIYGLSAPVPPTSDFVLILFVGPL